MGTLKGGVSYTEGEIEYVWRSTNNACEKCQALNGQKFRSPEDIPDKPHPNCRCWVEIDEGSDDSNGGYDIDYPDSNDPPEDDELCDCWNKIQDIMDKAFELEGDLLSSSDEVNAIQDEIQVAYTNFQKLYNQVRDLKEETSQEIPCGDNCLATGFAANIDKGFDIEEFTRVNDYYYEEMLIFKAFIETLDIFLQNMNIMKNTVGSYDKYYHAKANCESAELNEIAILWAGVWSIGKEVFDIIKKIFERKLTLMQILADSARDLQADYYGLMKGKEHGICSEKVKDVGKLFGK